MICIFISALSVSYCAPLEKFLRFLCKTECETVAVGLRSVKLEKLISVNASHNV